MWGKDGSSFCPSKMLALLFFFCEPIMFQTKKKQHFFSSKLPFELQLELSLWFVCNLLLVFITQLRFHIWQGRYQRAIWGPHTCVMAPVKLQHDEAPGLKPLWSAYPLLPAPLLLLFTNGHIWQGAAPDSSGKKKSPGGMWTGPQPLFWKKAQQNLDAPTSWGGLSPLPSCSHAVEGSSQGGGGGGGVGTDSSYVWSEGRQPLAGAERCLAKRPSSYLITWRGSGPFSHN